MGKSISKKENIDKIEAENLTKGAYEHESANLGSKSHY